LYEHVIAKFGMAMNALYLLRHAKAETQGSGDDRSRKLAEAGRKDAKAIAAAMAEARIAPELVLCSSAARTRQTLEIVLPALKPAPQIVYEDELYLADAKHLLARLRHVPKATRTVMLVGHNPGLVELAVLLSDRATGPLMAQLAQGLPTSALASFDLPLPWPELEIGSAHLRALFALK
jgi:phosphohistidine phosphatase